MYHVPAVRSDALWCDVMFGWTVGILSEAMAQGSSSRQQAEVERWNISSRGREKQSKEYHRHRQTVGYEVTIKKYPAERRAPLHYMTITSTITTPQSNHPNAPVLWTDEEIWGGVVRSTYRRTYCIPNEGFGWWWPCMTPGWRGDARRCLSLRDCGTIDSFALHCIPSMELNGMEFWFWFWLWVLQYPNVHCIPLVVSWPLGYPRTYMSSLLPHPMGTRMFRESNLEARQFKLEWRLGWRDWDFGPPSRRLI